MLRSPHIQPSTSAPIDIPGRAISPGILSPAQRSSFLGINDTFDRGSFIPAPVVHTPVRPAPPEPGPAQPLPEMADAAVQALEQPAAAAQNAEPAPEPNALRQKEAKRWQEKADRGFTEEFPRRISMPAALVERPLMTRMGLTAIWRGLTAFFAHMVPRIQLGIGVNIFRFFE